MPSIHDFSIQTLGEPRFVSPMPLGETPGEGGADFVHEESRVLFHLDTARLAEDLGLGEPPSLERAGPRHHVYFHGPEVRAAVVTSGGLCPGINDVVRSIVLTLVHHYGAREILGIRYGLRGFVDKVETPIRLTPEEVKYVHLQGGSFLASSRGTPPVEEIVRFLDRQAIQLLFMIGGDGTQKAVAAITRGVLEAGLKTAVIGIPKTIDNDILYVDQTFGFSTAVSRAREAIHAAHAEAQGAYNGVGLVRLMGRDSGFIAAQAALASGEANFVLIPEVPFDLDGPEGFLAVLHRRLLARRHALVVVAEGAGQHYLAAEAEKRGQDASGNQRLGDIGRYLRGRIESYFRERDLPVTVKYIDPGYVIRSAPANASDATYCQRLGQNAVHAAMAGRTGMMVGRIHGEQVHVPVREVTRGRKRLHPEHPLWRAVLQGTGQPLQMTNP
ncbi:MAG: ATP-dependent 6-phosphofructokinase [Acidobacteriota bacterium]|nr:ATP-dependent 6-phosphofructokinase [Acidobacteriota bacterium]MDQ7087180.1 ATP-dependent 6-phosphofructokinase [Acidobacteriota bacterium]